MIIGFGFGSPLAAFIMLIITALISYTIYGLIRNHFRDRSTEDGGLDVADYRESRKEYYRQQRNRAYRMLEEYDLTDDEIERKIDEELKNR